MNIEVPEDLYLKAAEIARAQGVSVDSVFISAFVEQLAALDRINIRAARGDRNKFLAVLDKVPDSEPDPQDLLRV